MTFPKKSFVQWKWATLGMKMVHPHNFGFTIRIVLKFCKMKRTKRFMENHFDGLLEKKKHFGGWGGGKWAILGVADEPFSAQT